MNSARGPDDSEYMTVAEFAALPSGAHHAVWADRSISTIELSGGNIRRYHRAQVLALLTPRNESGSDGD